MQKGALLLVLISLLVSCKKQPDSLSPVVKPITESIYASGIVKSRNQYEVFSTVSGLLEEILLPEGSSVQKGEPIMRLVNTTAVLNTENAKLAARYGSLSANADKLNELRENIVTLEAKKQNDATMLSRQRHLWAQGIGTRNELDARELAAKTSAGAYNAAKMKYNDMQRQLQFQHLQAQNNLRISRSLATDYLIRSDVNGKVYKTFKKKGEMVSPQAPIALIGDANSFMLELQVDEYDIARIKEGQKVLLQMDSYKGQVYEAQIEKIDPSMNSQSRSFTVEAVFTKGPPVLYPNLTAEANIIVQVKQKALIIPRSYLLEDDYVVLSSKEKRKVTVGLKDYQNVEILSGLNPSDKIIRPAP